MKLYAHRPVSAKTARDNALWGLRFFGPEANAAVTPLIKLVRSAKEPWPHALACNALAEAGRDSPEAQAVFLEELKGGDKVRRSRAVLAIWSAGWKLKESVPLLMKDLANEQQNPLDHLNQLLALGAIGPDAKDAVPLLIPLLKYQQLRPNILRTLKGIGPGGSAAVPALIEVMKSEPDKFTHPLVIETLINIDPAAAAALPVLEDQLKDESGVIRVLAAIAIGKIRGHLESAVPTLMRELENEERETSQISWEFHVTESHNIAGFALSPRQAAAWFLGEIGPSAAAALPALTRILQSPRGSLGNEWRRILAVRAIWRIDQKAESVLPALRDALNSKDEFQCVMAAKILGEMGPPAKSLVPELLEARKVSLAIRREVNDALKKIDPEALIKASSNKIVR
jgi:HEAT repeat protein